MPIIIQNLLKSSPFLSALRSISTGIFHSPTSESVAKSSEVVARSSYSIFPPSPWRQQKFKCSLQINPMFCQYFSTSHRKLENLQIHISAPSSSAAPFRKPASPFGTLFAPKRHKYIKTRSKHTGFTPTRPTA